jgi:hypothetical protein
MLRLALLSIALFGIPTLGYAAEPVCNGETVIVEGSIFGPKRSSVHCELECGSPGRLVAQCAAIADVANIEKKCQSTKVTLPKYGVRKLVKTDSTDPKPFGTTCWINFQP